MDAGSQAAAISAFERSIFTVWMPMQTKFVQSVQWKDKSELEFEHIMDSAVHASSIKPYRAKFAMADAAASEKKSVAGDRFKRAW